MTTKSDDWATDLLDDVEDKVPDIVVDPAKLPDPTEEQLRAPAEQDDDETDNDSEE